MPWVTKLGVAYLVCGKWYASLGKTMESLQHTQTQHVAMSCTAPKQQQTVLGRKSAVDTPLCVQT